MRTAIFLVLLNKLFIIVTFFKCDSYHLFYYEITSCADQQYPTTYACASYRYRQGFGVPRCNLRCYTVLQAQDILSELECEDLVRMGIRASL